MMGERHEVFGHTNYKTLDGMVYLKEIENGDYDAIRWMNNEIKGQAKILETPGEAYKNTSRVSSFTGLPTVIGWKSHEVMWGREWRKVNDRERDANKIYSTTDINKTMNLIKKYGIRYVYLGSLEKQEYPRSGIAKFGNNSQFFELVFDNKKVQIYRVVGSSQLSNPKIYKSFE
jgi:uncharacterized membrane protein